MKQLIFIPLLILFLGCNSSKNDPKPSNSNNNNPPITNPNTPTYNGNKRFEYQFNEIGHVDLKDSIPNLQTIVSADISYADVVIDGTKLTLKPKPNFTGTTILTVTIKDTKANVSTISIQVNYFPPPESETYFNFTYKGVTYNLDAQTSGFGYDYYNINFEEFEAVRYCFFNKTTGQPFRGGIPLSVIQSLVGNRYIINSNVGTNPDLIKSDYSFSLTFEYSENSNDMTTIRSNDTTQYYLEFDSFDYVPEYPSNTRIRGQFKVQMRNEEIVTGNFALPILLKE